MFWPNFPLLVSTSQEGQIFRVSWVCFHFVILGMPKCLFLQHPLSSCKDKVNLYWMWRNPGVQMTCVLINLKALNLACDGAYKPVWLPFQLSLVLTRLNLWFLLICSHSTPGPVWEHQCSTQSVRQMKLSSDSPECLYSTSGHHCSPGKCLNS